MNKTQENFFQAVSLLNASQIKGEKKVSSYNEISLMTYNLYMLSKWTAEVANCVLEGLLGEYHISYHIILFPITYPWTPIFFIKAVNG